ncbi:MAG TPA: inositol monophosphatase family protein [Tepidiformaceae bacterium]|nr:inositol monophosphatase family protein [Tepidiformaceae bacterium]
MSELSELLSIALRAADVARGVIMPLYQSGTSVELKADRTPVTIADRNAETAMREFLAKECPGHGILGEEFGETAGDGRHRWILDPIDGTKSFMHHVPLFGTLIALERDGEPVVGVIACHAAGETASAAKGLGAFLNGSPVRVSGVRTLEEATVSMTSYARTAAKHPKGFDGLVSRSKLARSWGDCYGYLMVAAGRAEVMLDPDMSIWDAAALYPVITEAGGGFSTWDWTPGVGDSVVATNGPLHEEVIAVLRADREK